MRISPLTFLILNMYHVYILRSRKDHSFYIGYTTDIVRRIKEHNNGAVGYTKRYRPWKLVYYETYTALKDARMREDSLKRYAKAFGQLKRRIKNSLNI